MSDLYPIFLNLEEKSCLVVGGGAVALRKVQGLESSGARITVVAIKPLSALTALASEGHIELHARAFKKEDARDRWIIFCATDREKVNREVFEAGEALGIPVNVADQPHLCRFQVPGRYRQGPLQVAVSTQGESPALSRKLRKDLGKILDPWAPRFVEWLGVFRTRLIDKQQGDPAWRGDFLNRLIDLRFDELKDLAESVDRASFDTLVQKEFDKWLRKNPWEEKQ